MKKNKIWLILFGILGLVLSMPSIVFLIENKTVSGYEGQNYYFINKNDLTSTIIGTIIFFAIIIFMFVIYLRIIKNSAKFKNIKQILIVAGIIGIMFLICLPNTSTDVFYYMGTGRVLSEYNENPYYHTIEEIDTGNDEILSNVSAWRDTKVVYGPLWVIITFLLNKICFGSITVLLYLFKIVELLLHLGCTILIYKLTRRKKFAIIYAFNPLILLEFLVNCHNDIYMIFFALLAIYFVKNKKNIWLAILSLFLATSIKYITLVLYPFLVLYYLRDKKISSKIGWGSLYTLIFLVLNVIMYIPCFNSLKDAIGGIFGQQQKFMNSIYLFIRTTLKNASLSDTIYSAAFFVILYMAIVDVSFILIRKLKFSVSMKFVYELFYMIIFGLLTTLGSWYLSWIFIVLFWTKSKNIRNTIWVQFFFELTYVVYIFLHSDSYKYNQWTVPFIALGMCIITIIRRIYDKQKRRICCRNN